MAVRRQKSMPQPGPRSRADLTPVDRVAQVLFAPRRLTNVAFFFRALHICGDSHIVPEKC